MCSFLSLLLKYCIEQVLADYIGTVSIDLVYLVFDGDFVIIPSTELLGIFFHMCFSFPLVFP